MRKFLSFVKMSFQDTYDVNGELISMNYLGNEYFYVKNIQGDILESVK